MKILASVYACEPNRGSEPGVGWNVIQVLAKHHEVWALTAGDTHRKAIEDEVAKNPVPNLHFVYHRLPRFLRWLKYGDEVIPIGYHLDYYLWQIGAFFVARRLHREIGFDLVHHVTYARYYTPSFLMFLRVPFIWGPVGGGQSTPRLFWRDFSFKGKFYECLHELAKWLGNHDPFVGMATRRSSFALGTNKETTRRLLELGAKRVKYLGECRLSQQDIEYFQKQPMPNSNQLRFISIGRLIHSKAFHLGLEAFARAKISGAEYWIVGEGFERKRWENLAKQLGISEDVRFWRGLPREETLKKLVECHILIHPSLRESGSWVCLEAMAAGLPVICMNLGGPAMIVSEESGFKISAFSPEQVVDDLTKAMIRLASDRILRTKMGEAGRKRVKEVFSWKVMGHELTQVYTEAKQQKSNATNSNLFQAVS